MSRKKEEFDKWIENIINDLNSRSNHSYEVSFLKKSYLKKLQKIFDEYIDNDCLRAKEVEEADETASYEAKAVILEAYGQTYSDLEEEELMDHYMSSSNYP